MKKKKKVKENININTNISINININIKNIHINDYFIYFNVIYLIWKKKKAIT